MSAGSSAPAADIGPRTPRPEPRVNALAMLSAGAAAAVAYVLALSTNVLPPPGFAVVLFAATPVLAAVSLPVIAARAAAEDDDGLRWFFAGLLVALPAMLLQLVSLPLVAPGGGALGTSNSGNAALYLAFHVAVAAGALLGLAGVRGRWRRWFVAGGWVLVAALAAGLVPLPPLLTDSGDFTVTLTVADLVLGGVTAAVAVACALRSGRAAMPLHTAVCVALSLSAYDLVLNGISARRFDPVWWSSLSMRVATYAVLAAVAVGVVLRQLATQERYAEQELTRRERQLRDSLATTQELLAEVVRNTEALQRALLPTEIVAPPGVEVAARQRTSGEDAVWNTWYDTVPLAWGGVALVVGLVEGQDVTAAPVVGLVRGALRSYALEGHPPGIVLERANAFLLSAGAVRPVTVAYAEVYPDDRLATIAVAGAPSVVVTEAGGRQTSLAARSGTQLGVAADGRWGETTILLAEGAAVVLSTEPAVVATAPDSPQIPTARRSGAAPISPAGLADEVVGQVPEGTPLAVVVARPGAAHHASVHRTLPVHRMSAGVARSWVADLFRVWQESGTLPASAATADHGHTAELLITELVSNSVRHGDLSVEVRVALAGLRLRVSVFDSSHRMPVLRRAGEGDTAGRGLFLVESMASAWGVEVRDEGGKDVWLELDLASPAQDAAEGAELDEDALLAAFSDDDL